jgi:hypothetical protein
MDDERFHLAVSFQDNQFNIIHHPWRLFLLMIK